MVAEVKTLQSQNSEIDRMELPSHRSERIWTRLARGSLFMARLFGSGHRLYASMI